MNIQHDQEMSSPANQVFWIDVAAADDTDWNAQFRAWLAIGEEDIGDYGELTSYRKAKWNAANSQALQLEALKLAYRTEAVRWLILNDIEFDLNPFATGWLPDAEYAEVKISIPDDNAAMRFKLAFVS